MNPWRRLADWSLAEVNWSHIGHMGWVMTWPPFDDPRSLTVVASTITISAQMWRDTNGGWMHARRWPSLNELFTQAFTRAMWLDPMTSGPIEYK